MLSRCAAVQVLPRATGGYEPMRAAARRQEPVRSEHWAVLPGPHREGDLVKQQPVAAHQVHGLRAQHAVRISGGDGVSQGDLMFRLRVSTCRGRSRWIERTAESGAKELFLSPAR